MFLEHKKYLSRLARIAVVTMLAACVATTVILACDAPDHPGKGYTVVLAPGQTIHMPVGVGYVGFGGGCEHTEGGTCVSNNTSANVSVVGC